jgi:hypothetical protein
MLHYMQEMALAKGKVQRRIPSVTTATRQATSKWTAGPKEAEKKGKDQQVKDGEMAAKLLPILPPPPPLCPPITTICYLHPSWARWHNHRHRCNFTFLPRPH